MEMEENDIIVRYFGIITVGDEHHKEGEIHRIYGNLDDVKEHGIRLEINADRWRTFYHYYPVNIIKKVYRLDLIETETVEGGNRDMYRKWGETIGHDWQDNETYDWKDHWC